mmetsp:Transcript_25630/g.56478  ORF Transcript_25630/g.56478 Transcript_25630/m.56478 type:complete len:166 (+) Transcript_25630:49-546(+)
MEEPGPKRRRTGWDEAPAEQPAVDMSAAYAAMAGMGAMGGGMGGMQMQQPVGGGYGGMPAPMAPAAPAMMGMDLMGGAGMGAGMGGFGMMAAPLAAPPASQPAPAPVASDTFLGGISSNLYNLDIGSGQGPPTAPPNFAPAAAAAPEKKADPAALDSLNAFGAFG